MICCGRVACLLDGLLLLLLLMVVKGGAVWKNYRPGMVVEEGRVK